jgi:hypothetical protein
MEALSEMVVDGVNVLLCISIWMINIFGLCVDPLLDPVRWLSNMYIVRADEGDINAAETAMNFTLLFIVSVSFIFVAFCGRKILDAHFPAKADTTFHI